MSKTSKGAKKHQDTPLQFTDIIVLASARGCLGNTQSSNKALAAILEHDKMELAEIADLAEQSLRLELMAGLYKKLKKRMPKVCAMMTAVDLVDSLLRGTEDADASTTTGDEATEPEDNTTPDGTVDPDPVTEHPSRGSLRFSSPGPEPEQEKDKEPLPNTGEVNLEEIRKEVARQGSSSPLADYVVAHAAAPATDEVTVVIVKGSADAASKVVLALPFSF